LEDDAASAGVEIFVRSDPRHLVEAISAGSLFITTRGIGPTDSIARTRESAVLGKAMRAEVNEECPVEPDAAVLVEATG
jgi:hypothetical protein